MISAISVSRFTWTPLVWIFVVFFSFLIIAVVCNIFDSNAENEIIIREKSSADENEIVKDKAAIFARKYLVIWMRGYYQYILLPVVFVVTCLLVLFVE